MEELIKLQEQYIEAVRRHTKKTVGLLLSAKHALGNHIGSCRTKGCTSENRCRDCKIWTKVWDDIDNFLKENEEAE